MDMGATLYQQICSDLATLAQLLRKAKIRHATVSRLPIAAHTGERDHAFDEITEIAVEKLYDNDALDAYLAIIKPQYNSAGLSPRAGRRAVGIIHVNSEQPQAITKLISKINLQKKALETMFGAIENPHHRRKYWREIDPGVMPLSVYRELHCIDDTNSVDSIFFSWVLSGFSQRYITRNEAASIIRCRIDRLADQGFLSAEMANVDIAKISHIDESELIMRRPTKVHPIMEIHGHNKRAAVPVLCLQKKPLNKYHHLNDFHAEDYQPKSMPLGSLKPVVPECHIYQKITR